MLTISKTKINVVHVCIAFCLLSSVCSETGTGKSAALNETSEAKRIVMHSEDAVAAEVLRLRAELETTKTELGNTRAELGNTTNILQTVLSQMSALEKKLQSIESSKLNTKHGISFNFDYICGTSRKKSVFEKLTSNDVIQLTK